MRAHAVERRRLTSAREIVETRKLRVDVERGAHARGDAERRDVETYFRRGYIDRFDEPFPCPIDAVHRSGTHPVHFEAMVSHAATPAGPGGHDGRLHETVARLLRAHGQRLTHHRGVVVDVLADAAGPLTIPEILAARSDLAQSSVYRNLVVLEEAGVVHRMLTRDEFARYELAEDLTEHHHHLVCSNCGRVEDLPATQAVERSVAAAIDEAAQVAGFQTLHHRLDLVGLCANCGG